MKIGLLSPSIYMSPTRYNQMIFAPRELSIALADGLVDKGHEVYFFTAGDVKTKAKLISGDEAILNQDLTFEKLDNAYSERKKWAQYYIFKRDYELDLTMRCYEMAQSGQLDIVHSYHDSLAHFFNKLTQFTTVYTLHDPLPKRKKSLEYWLLSKFKNHNFVSISNSFIPHQTLKLNFVGTVYHGININEYQLSSNKQNYLTAVGRMVPEKGIDVAIKAAIKANSPLKIATSSMEENRLSGYFQEVIDPLVSSTKLVSFTGFMHGQEKVTYLSSARALLFPIIWEEPFGMVMIEAMACGTPVIAYNRGSVPEIIKDGVTGFIVEPDDENSKLEIRNSKQIQPFDPAQGKNLKLKIKKKGFEGLVEAINRIDEIDPAACRKHVEENFTVEKMVEGYEKVYKKVLSVKR